MPTDPCTLCPGMTALAKLDKCERIIIDGRRIGPDKWKWTVDVITETRDGHAHTEQLDEAIFAAVSQIR